MKGLEKIGFFDKLKQGLGKTKTSFDEKINNVFSSFRKVDEDFLEELEEILIMSDIGMDTSVKIVDRLRNIIKRENIKDEEDVKNALRKEMQSVLDEVDNSLHLETKPSVILVVGVNGVGKTTSIGKIANRLRKEMQNVLDEVDNSLNLQTKPSVILVVGVNGVGKTTSIGKIANRLRKEGKKVVVAAADTFRAAAVEQLEIWSKRSGAEIVKRDEGRDPASVVYDAIKKTKEIDADVLIVDTAGRLHNKQYLMDELRKIKKVIDKEMEGCSQETLLVIDGTTGQNAISQVKAFKEETDVTGLVLTKMDGTAKGGVVLGIVEENKIPVKFIGVGEQMEDMEIFNSEEFVKAII